MKPAESGEAGSVAPVGIRARRPRYSISSCSAAHDLPPNPVYVSPTKCCQLTIYQCITAVLILEHRIDQMMFKLQNAKQIYFLPA